MIEYLIINITTEEREEMDGQWREKILDKFLDKYGKENWELCAVDNIYFYFKRNATQ